MREIPLTRNMVALVDDANYERLARHKWHALKSGHTWYAARHGSRRDKPRRYIFMHKEILLVSPGMMVDHKDRNGLHNWEDNLRPCTKSQNAANAKKQSNGITSRYRGVCWDKSRNKWLAQIQIRSKQTYLGRFVDDIDAARAYNRAAYDAFGEFAHLNLVEETL